MASCGGSIYETSCTVGATEMYLERHKIQLGVQIVPKTRNCLFFHKLRVSSAFSFGTLVPYGVATTQFGVVCFELTWRDVLGLRLEYTNIRPSLSNQMTQNSTETTPLHRTKQLC